MIEPKIGDRFGRLTIESDFVSMNGRRWQCKCDCGSSGNMVNITGLRKRLEVDGGCGSCYKQPKHGYGSSKNPTYSKYQAMKQRCSNPNHKDFANYGGRGIKVCEDWNNSFEKFLADMGEALEGMTIERNDVNGNYEPLNCRWATKKEQARNMRSNVAVCVDGITYGTLIEAAEVFKLPYGTVRARVVMYGWSHERALKTPIDTAKRSKSFKPQFD